MTSAITKKEATMTTLTPGDAAPAFEALDQNGVPVDSNDFNGRKRFLFFYPKANTSG
jgi:thioredoxin-dependent peroxiredoxin